MVCDSVLDSYGIWIWFGSLLSTGASRKQAGNRYRLKFSWLGHGHIQIEIFIAGGQILGFHDYILEKIDCKEAEDERAGGAAFVVSSPHGSTEPRRTEGGGRRFLRQTEIFVIK